MILHCVFCSFRDDVSQEQRRDILEQLAVFSTGLDGVMAFDHGANHDFENKSPDHGAGFVIRFRDKQALEAYAEHPTHEQLGGRLCELCNGGADGIVVYDLVV